MSDKERIEELERVCAQLYQVLGTLSYKYKIETPSMLKAMDNASEARLVHQLLPTKLDDY